MNARIEEIAEQAGWFQPCGQPSNWNDEHYIVSPEEMKKFAELIIREFAYIAARNQAENTSWDISEIIKEHFGLK